MKSPMSYPPLTASNHQTWVQTERAAHEAWGHLISTSPRAAQLLHHLVAHMDQSAAVVASYQTLSEICGFSVATVRRAVDTLKVSNWVQVVQVGGKGGANAFVINSRVAWAANRKDLPHAVFSARVISSASEQDSATLTGPELKRIPTLMTPGERQLPTGDGEDPPSQPTLTGIEEPELPSISAPSKKSRAQKKIDPETGEIL